MPLRRYSFNCRSLVLQPPITTSDESPCRLLMVVPVVEGFIGAQHNLNLGQAPSNQQMVPLSGPGSV